MASTYQIVEAPLGSTLGYQPYESALTLWRCRDAEVVISGPAETGKTRAALEKLNALLWKYSGAQAAVIRKTRQSMTGSVLQTYERKVLGAETPVRLYGGASAQWYDYPNGSRLFVGGMDDANKVLSSERDFIYVNQAEELSLDDWEKLTTRATGRAGNAPYAQIMGDCNPGPPTHWILRRREAGALTFIESRHEDNPTLYDQTTKALTEQGARTMAVLDRLTGVRYHRLRMGLWASAEGIVYETYDPAVHLIDPFPIPSDWRRFRVVDFGYTNPFVCQWWAIDPDGRMYRYREMYHTGRTVRAHAARILRHSEGESIETTVCDHDAEDRATLEENGIPTMGAVKAVSVGIQAVEERLRIAGDKKPRLYLMRTASVEVDPALREARKPVSTEEEIESYVWVSGTSGRAAKEAPVKVDDHGMDALRYAVCYADGVGWVAPAIEFIDW